MCLFIISFSFLIAKDYLFLTKDYMFVVGLIIYPLLLLVSFFVNKTMALNPNVVVAKHHVFYLFRLKAEESFKCEHRVVLLELHEFAHDC